MYVAIGIVLTVLAVAALFVSVVSRNAGKWQPDVNYTVGSVGDVITHVPNGNKVW
tara:strand:- start:403 stop:567 length:165 start_codon:yes stop_codon:yes gene_type:complete